MIKSNLLSLVLIIVCGYVIKAQTPPVPTHKIGGSSLYNQSSALGDTLDFSPFADGTVITNQYQNKSVIFDGYNGSMPPSVYEYNLSASYGKILHSDNWFNALRMNFVDSANASQYRLAKRIEFDNVLDTTISFGGPDYMSIDVYDSMDVLIYHYLSISPERVVIDLGFPAAAYVTIDDSAMTAYGLDNVLIDFGSLTSIDEPEKNNILIYPNPFSTTTTLYCDRFLSNATIQIYNINGQLVKQMDRVSGQTITLQRDYLKNGMHLIRIIQDGILITENKLFVID